MTEIQGKIADIVYNGAPCVLWMKHYRRDKIGFLFVKILDTYGVARRYLSVDLMSLLNMADYQDNVAVDMPQDKEYMGILLGTGLFEATGEIAEVNHLFYPLLRYIGGSHD